MKIASVLVFTVLCSVTVGAQSPDIVVDRLLGNSKFKAAQEFLDKDHDRIVEENIRLTEIPAPPFKEDKRGAAVLELMKQLGLQNVERDAEGNVMGLRKGTGQGPLVAIAAHLDTVFPEGTDVKVKREGTRLSAPGIGDDTRGLAVLLALVRAMDAAKFDTRSDILFVADVGEEGEGDLRGMKYLFTKGPYKDRIKFFISLDGTGTNTITNGAVGSRRYRVTFKGPGGHSYSAFGLVNPAFAMAKAIDKFSKIQVPDTPKTTFSVGVVGGGTSVNSIPFESWMEVDMRSESPEELAKVVESFIGLVHEAADEENKARSTAQGKIEVEMKMIGDRPSGSTSIGSTTVQTATAIIRGLGMSPIYSTGSQDANIPISLKIPAITLGAGGSGSRTHALEEYINVEKTASLKGIYVALGTLLSLAGAQ